MAGPQFHQQAFVREPVEHCFEHFAFRAVGPQLFHKLLESGSAMRQLAYVVKHAQIAQVL